MEGEVTVPFYGCFALHSDLFECGVVDEVLAEETVDVAAPRVDTYSRQILLVPSPCFVLSAYRIHVSQCQHAASRPWDSRHSDIAYTGGS